MPNRNDYDHDRWFREMCAYILGALVLVGLLFYISEEAATDAKVKSIQTRLDAEFANGTQR